MSSYSQTEAGSDTRPTVLLVDDCVGVRDLYELALTESVVVKTATRGEEALAIAEKDHPDVIVLDIVMPGMTGWETLECLRSNPVTTSIPIIMLTGDDRRDAAERARLNDVPLLHKPCAADKLLDAIRAEI